MSQDEHPQKCARARHKARTKEATTRSGATAPTERHCADKARHTKKGSKTKSPFCVVLKTYHLIGIHHKTCLKRSNFHNRKLCPIDTNMEHHGNSKGTRNRRKNKIRQNELRQGSKKRQLQHTPRLIGRDPELRPVLQISGLHLTYGIFASFSRGFKSWSARKQGDCCTEPNCYEWNACQPKMRKRGK